MLTFDKLYILQDENGNPIVGINDGIINDKFILKYYDANTGNRYSGVVSLTNSGGSFYQNFILQDDSNGPIIGKVESLTNNDRLIIKYYNANTGVRYSGVVFVVSIGSASTAGLLKSHQQTAVAGNTITLTAPIISTDIVEIIFIDGVPNTNSWTQLGLTVTFNDSTVFAGGEKLILIYKSI